MDEHSSLFCPLANYGRKKFYNTGPWLTILAEEYYRLGNF